MNPDTRIDKRALRHSFNRAAASYDAAAVLQFEVCERMLSRLDYLKPLRGMMLDVGSGTGYGSRKLATRYPDNPLVAVDIALAMHHRAQGLNLSTAAWWQKFMPGAKVAQATRYLAGDVEALPIKAASASMVWSNLTVQWCNDLGLAFAEIHRVLQVEGLFMFSTFGPDTLKELRQAFGGMDAYTHFNRFVDMHDIGDLLVRQGFATPVIDMEIITLTYAEAIDVMRDLQAIGAHNVTAGRRPGLSGKNAWQKAVRVYEGLRKDGKLPATFEVIYGHAWKPPARPKTKLDDGRQIIQFDPYRPSG